jgi:hypothetical protein
MMYLRLGVFTYLSKEAIALQELFFNGAAIPSMIPLL